MNPILTRNIARNLIGSIAALLTAHSAKAAPIYWDGLGTGWDDVAAWDTAVDGTGGNPGAIPGSLDVANFSINTINSAQTVNLNGDQSALGLVFLGTNTATTLLHGGGTDRTLTLGTSGITVNSGAGAVTIGSASAGQNVALTLAGAQTWTNNSTANALTVQNAINTGANLLTLTTTTGNITVNGAISGSAGLRFIGAAPAGGGNQAILTLNGANNYTGETFFGGGANQQYSILRAGSSTAFGAASATLRLAPKTNQERLVVQLFGNNITLAGLNQTGGNDGGPAGEPSLPTSFGGFLTNGAASAATFTLDNTIDSSFMGAIRNGGTGSLAITKKGTGALTLRSNNTFHSYTGQLTIEEGTLAVDGVNNVNTEGVLGNNALDVIMGGSGKTGILRYFGGNASTTKAFSLATGGTGNFQVDDGTGTVQTLTISGAISGDGALAKSGADTLTLSATNTFTGGTTVRGGILKLDYTSTLSKLSDTGVLTFAGGTIDLTAGSHTEVVASTTVNSGASGVTRASGTGILRMGAITRNAGGFVNFGATNIASTSTANDATGILGSWATIGGLNWATNTGTDDGGAVGNNLIGAYAGYVDINARGSTINDDSTTNVRINAAGAGGNIALSAATTNINTLLQGSTTAATVDTTGKTLQTSAIMLGAGMEALTIGLAPGSGTLTAATAGGDLLLINNRTDRDLTIKASVQNNTSASSLTKVGAGNLVLAGANNFSGGLNHSAGTLTFASPGSLGSGTLVISNATTINSFLNGTLTSNAPVTINGDFTFSGTSSLNLGTGAVTLGTETGSARTITTSGNALSILTLGGVISNGTTASSLTKAGPGTLALTGANTYTGTTTISNGTVNANSIVVSGGSSSLGNAADAVVLGDSGNRGTLNYTGGAATYIRGLTINNGGGTLTNNGSGLLTVATGGIAIAQNANFTVGGPVQNISISSVISGGGSSLTKTGLDSVMLSAANTYTGGTSVDGGTLTVTGSLNGTTGTPLTFNASGTLNVSEASGVSQGMGALSFRTGEGTVQSTNNGGNSFLTFSSYTPQQASPNANWVFASGNFVTTNGTNGVDNGIFITGQAAGFINKSLFYNGTNYAAMNTAGGYVRGLDYGVDAGTATSAGGTTVAGTTNLQVTGNVTAQASANFTTIHLNNTGGGAPNFTLDSGATVGNAVGLKGILKSGGGTSTISGGYLRTTTSPNGNPDNADTDLVIRVAGATDTLTINSSIIKQSPTGGNTLSKVGSGNLNLNGNNTLAGFLSVEGGGAVTLGGANTFSSDVIVGRTSAGNTLNISGNGSEFSGGGTLRIGEGSFGNNTVDISSTRGGGTPSMRIHQLTLGGSSSNNTLIVRNGANYRLVSGNSTWNIGTNVGSDNNALLVTGAGTELSRGPANGSAIQVGNGGSYNSLTVSAGAHFYGKRIIIGNSTGSSFNTQLVTGLGTWLDNPDSQFIFSVGGATGASNNTFRVADQAIATMDGNTQTNRSWNIGGAHGANDNAVIVDGLGTQMRFNQHASNVWGIGGIGGSVPTDSYSRNSRLDVINGASLAYTTTTAPNGTSLYLVGVESAVNLGNGTNISTARLGATGANASVVLANADSRLNFNSGRLIAGVNNALVSGLGQVQLNGPAYISTAHAASTISTVIAGGGSLTKEGIGTLSFSAANTYTGGTIVNAGTLALDYTTTVGSKLADAGILTLSGGALDLRNGDSAHVEEVASTSLGAGRSGVTQTFSTSTLRMNTITPGVGVVDFGAASIADTDNLNVSGILGAWATVGGTDWAMNSTNLADGAITAYAAYTDYSAFGSTLANVASNNARLNTATGTGNISLGAPVTTINTLLQSNAAGTGVATVNTLAGALETNGIMIGAGADAVTIGVTAGDGSLRAATAGGNLVLNNHNTSGTVDLTINAPILANGASGLATAGRVFINGVNTYTGPTGVGGALTIGGAGQLNSGNYAGAISIAASGNLVMNSSASQTLSGVISGDGGITQSGAGTTTLSGANTYTGVTTVNAGTLVANNQTAFGDPVRAALVFGSGSAGTVQLNNNSVTVFNLNTNATVGTPAIENLGNGAATLVLNAIPDPTISVANSVFGNNSNTYAGVLRDGGGGGTLKLVKNGTGSLTLGDSTGTNINTFSGGTEINGGTITIAHKDGFGASAGSVFLASTTVLQQTGFDGNTVGGAISNPIVLGPGDALSGGEVVVNIPSTQRDMWLTGDISGSGRIRVISDGTGRALTLSGAKTFTGGIVQSSGTGGNTRLGGAQTNQYPTIQIDNIASLGTGTFRAQINGTDLTRGTLTSIADLSGGTGVTNAIDIALGARLVVGHSSSTNHLQISGVISGGGNLVKKDDATLILSGTNTYTGTTTVNAGTLNVNGSLADNTVTVNTGATLGGTGTINGSVTVNGTLTPGGSGIVESLGSRALTFSNGSALNHQFDSSVALGVAAALQKVTGNLNLGVSPNTVSLNLSDLATSPVAFAGNTKFSLLNYTGTWNGGFFTLGGNELIDGEEFTSGLNTWKIDYDDTTGGSNFTGDHDVTGKFVNLTAISTGPTPYEAWIDTFTSLTGADKLPDADPDKDGYVNFLEFAIDGDPSSGANRGKQYGLTSDTDNDPDTNPELILTIAVRSGTPTFSGFTSWKAVMDGIQYEIEGDSASLSFASSGFIANVSPAIISGLPTPSAGYEYRSFTLNGSNALPSNGFMRVRAKSNP